MTINSEKTEKEIQSDGEHIKYRILSIFSYFLVLIVIGIQVWWYTTRVYRAPLPLDQMQQFELNDTIGKQFGIPLSLEYDVLINFVHADPRSLEIDITGKQVEEHLFPFVQKLTPVADIILKSEWLYTSNLGITPTKTDFGYAVKEDKLPLMISPLEVKLFAHSSTRPTINLVIYFSHCTSPLHIIDSRNEIVKSNSFISPTWGGIFLLNPDEVACDTKTLKPDLKQITSTFVTMLENLFKMDGIKNEDITLLKIRRIQEMVDSSKRTLKSLAELLTEINSIVISDEVAGNINLAIKSVDEAEEALSHGDIEKALASAKVAFINSEHAFSNPSLLALLYFPDDQKYAIYIPLFLPVMIPVVMSLFSIGKRMHSKEKTD